MTKNCFLLKFLSWACEFLIMENEPEEELLQLKTLMLHFKSMEAGCIDLVTKNLKFNDAFYNLTNLT